MANKKKEPLGFKTPSMRIQEEYKEILDQIKKKKTNWENILERILVGADDFFKDTEDFVKQTESKKEVEFEELIEIEHRVLAATLLMTQAFIASMGRDLAECDVRIAAIEKELKDLRKGL